MTPAPSRCARLLAGCGRRWKCRSNTGVPHSFAVSWPASAGTAAAAATVSRNSRRFIGAARPCASPAQLRGPVGDKRDGGWRLPTVRQVGETALRRRVLHLCPAQSEVLTNRPFRASVGPRGRGGVPRARGPRPPRLYLIDRYRVRAATALAVALRRHQLDRSATLRGHDAAGRRYSTRAESYAHVGRELSRRRRRPRRSIAAEEAAAREVLLPGSRAAVTSDCSLRPVVLEQSSSTQTWCDDDRANLGASQFQPPSGSCSPKPVDRTLNVLSEVPPRRHLAVMHGSTSPEEGLAVHSCGPHPATSPRTSDRCSPRAVLGARGIETHSRASTGRDREFPRCPAAPPHRPVRPP